MPVMTQTTPAPTAAVGGTPALVLATTNVAGVAPTFLRTDDQLGVFDATVPVDQASADVAATGTAAIAARRDHRHGMPTIPAAAAGGTPAPVFAATNVAGVATTFLRTDDQLGVFDATAPTDSAVGDAAAVGTAARAARRDHVHGREAFATPALVLSTTNAGGNATTLLRSNAQLAIFDATVPVDQASADVAATGTAAIAARRDHRHGMPTITSPPARATQAAIEAQTNEATYISPDRAVFSPGVAKVWCSISIDGALSVPDHGVSTVTDTGPGDRTINFSTAFSSAIYVPVVGTEEQGAADQRFGAFDTLGTGSCRFQLRNQVSPFALVDTTAFVAIFGDQ